VGKGRVWNRIGMTMSRREGTRRRKEKKDRKR
jgi:hypothetical protein